MLQQRLLAVLRLISQTSTMPLKSVSAVLRLRRHTLRTGYDDVFRVRTGRYRIIYSVEEDRLVVLVLKIGQRKDVYR